MKADRQNEPCCVTFGTMDTRDWRNAGAFSEDVQQYYGTGEGAEGSTFFFPKGSAADGGNRHEKCVLVVHVGLQQGR